MSNTDHELTEARRWVPPKERPIPEFVYSNLEPDEAPLAFTLPSLEAVNAFGAYSKPKYGKFLTLTNNGVFRANPYDFPSGLDKIGNWDDLRILDLHWGDETISAEELLRRQNELLDRFFVEEFKDASTANWAREQLKGVGLEKGKHLYRAINSYELQVLQNGKYLFYTTGNFETEDTYSRQEQGSQVRSYAKGQTGDYPGQIIRWRIADPLLYTRGGILLPKVEPKYAHFLPVDAEISHDQGSTFQPLYPFTNR